MQQRRVAVVVESVSERRRYCYWKLFLASLQKWDIEFDELPLGDPDPTALDWGRYGVIVVNWDAAGGDTTFRGNSVRDYFSGRASSLTTWVRNGGVFFCEVQSARGVPIQSSYDSIFGKGLLRVLTDSSEYQLTLKEDSSEHQPGHGYEHLWRGIVTRGGTALVNRRHRSHPLVDGIGPFVTSGYDFHDEAVLSESYRADGRARFSLYYRCPETLYSGWFVDWAFGWMPVLLEGCFGKFPVLLVRTEGKGAWVASTIRLTSTRTMPLIRNLVAFPLSKDRWQEYHRRVVQRRRLLDCILVISAAVVLALVTGALWLGEAFEVVAKYYLLATTLLGIGVVGIVLGIWKGGRRFLERRFR